MKILIADDHALFRAGIRKLLDDLADQPVIFEAGSAAEAGNILADNPDLDLLLLDLNMPGMETARSVAAFADLNPNVLIVVVSGSDVRGDVLAAIDSGAVGFLPKSSSPAVMLGALHLVLAGGVYLPPTLLDRNSPKPLHHAIPQAENEGAPQSSLSPRQREVLIHLHQGRANKEIARTLDISVSAVKMHVAAIFETLNVNNRTEAAHVAQRMGLIKDS